MGHLENRDEGPKDQHEGEDRASLQEELIDRYHEMAVWMGDRPSREEVARVLFGGGSAGQGTLGPSEIGEKLEPEATSINGPNELGTKVEPEVTSTKGMGKQVSPQSPDVGPDSNPPRIYRNHLFHMPRPGVRIR